MKYDTVQSYESTVFADIYRKGNLAEARDFLAEYEADTDEKVIFVANNLAIIDCDEGNYSESLRKLLSVSSQVHRITDDLLLGNFHNVYAVTCKKIGETENKPSYFDRAFIEYEAALFHFENINHPFVGGVLNNIANVLLALHKPIETHSYLERARKHFTVPARLAEIDETEAQAYLSEHDSQMACFFASRAYHMLLRADEPRLLIQAKRTLQRAMEAQEHSLTEWALAEVKGSVPQTANILQISRQGLGKRLKSPEYADLFGLADFCEKRGMHK